MKVSKVFTVSHFTRCGCWCQYWSLTVDHSTRQQRLYDPESCSLSVDESTAFEPIGSSDINTFAVQSMYEIRQEMAVLQREEQLLLAVIEPFCVITNNSDNSSSQSEPPGLSRCANYSAEGQQLGVIEALANNLTVLDKLSRGIEGWRQILATNSQLKATAIPMQSLVGR